MNGRLPSAIPSRPIRGLLQIVLVATITAGTAVPVFGADHFAGTQIAQTKPGDDLLKGGDDLLKGGDDLLKGGDDLLKGGDDLLKGGGDLLQLDRPKDAGRKQVDVGKTASKAHEALFAESRFPSAATCGTCHPQHYKEWSVSQHAYQPVDEVCTGRRRPGLIL